MLKFLKKPARFILLILIVILFSLLGLLLSGYSHRVKSEIISALSGLYPGGKASVRYAGIGLNEIKIEGLVYDPTNSAVSGWELLSIDQISIRAPWKQWLSQSKEIEIWIPSLEVRWAPENLAESSDFNMDDFFEEARSTVKDIDSEKKDFDQRIRFGSAEVKVQSTRFTGVVPGTNGEDYTFDKKYSIPLVLYHYGDGVEGATIDSVLRFAVCTTVQNLFKHLEQDIYQENPDSLDE